jgi:hypothetical protein
VRVSAFSSKKEMTKAKYFNFLTIYLVLLIRFSISVSGQTKVQKTALNKLIVAYGSKTIKSLNKNKYHYKYTLDNKNIFFSDLDGDGDFEAIVELFFCEKSSCHSTTNSSELVIYLNDNGKYSFLASKGFSLFGKVNSIEDGKIKIDVYSLDKNDPQCCPELKRKEIYALKNKKLVKIKR